MAEVDDSDRDHHDSGTDIQKVKTAEVVCVMTFDPHDRTVREL